MDVSVITVTWNNASTIYNQITSVQKHVGDIKFEQIIIDNGSQDNTIEVIKECIKKQNITNVTCIKAGKNLGFGRANNLGYDKAKGKYLLFLNPDMQIADGQLQDLLEYMNAQKDVGIASVKLTDKNGEPNTQALPRKFPTFFILYLFVSRTATLFSFLQSDYLMDGFDSSKEQQVDSVRGAFMFVRRSFLKKLGWAFDPRYFIWFEDVDICREAYANGYVVKHVPLMSCVDLIGQSFKQRQSLWKYKQFTQSLLQYAQKWHGPSWTISLSLVRYPMLWAMELRQYFLKK